MNLSEVPDDGFPQGFSPRRDTGGLIEAYISACRAGDADAAVATLSADAVFHSPFNIWSSRHMPSVFRARSIAFSNLLVTSVIRDRDRAVILWNATVGNAQAEAAELISVSDGAICRVDVFLRPAAVLDAVHQAMAAAWP